ncbi:zinc finger protein 384b isoform 2-T2 [Synchiropus picturatus]
MEDSHFNSSYFWSGLPVPTVQGPIENAMFLNKVKEHQEKSSTSFSSSCAPHYQTTLLTIPTPGSKSDGGEQTTTITHLHPPHSSPNVTVLPVPSTGIMTAAGLVITTPAGTLVNPTTSQSFIPGNPATTIMVSTLHSQDKKDGGGNSHVPMTPGASKRGRKRKVTVSSPIPGGGPGSETLILAHMTSDSNQRTGDPYDLSNEDEDLVPKDSTKTYRNHTESKPHKCPHCTKSFANSSYLAQHIRIHTGVKPYTCSYCQKSFRQLSHLQQHSRIHTGDRPYKCSHPGCDKSFTQLSNLQSHRRQHSKDKPFRCTNCFKGYTDATTLEIHMATHTVKHAKIYSCGLCNRSYTSETYLLKHIEKHNPDQMTAAAIKREQRNQQNQNSSQVGAQSRVEGTDGVPSRGEGGQNQGSYSQTDSISCPFDLHQYKTVSASDIQYKPVPVSDITSHKDLCLTVSASTIQVEHLNS